MPEIPILVLFIASSVAVAAPAVLDPRDGAVLPIDRGMDMLRQCSRDAPHHVAGTWLPKANQIQELEKRLPEAVETMALQRGSQYSQPAQFRRQYTGFIINGRKIIYVNAFPRSMGDPEPDGPPPAKHFDWHQQFVAVCDGGPAFFGVEYDPETKTFSHFEFNGVA